MTADGDDIGLGHGGADRHTIWCDARPMSAVRGSGESGYEVEDEGYDCPGIALARVLIETAEHGEMEFDVCEEHLEEWSQQGAIEEVVRRYE